MIFRFIRQGLNQSIDRLLNLCSSYSRPVWQSFGRGSFGGLSMLPLLPVLFFAMSATAQGSPNPVCPADSMVAYPAFGQLDKAPTVAFWERLETLPDNCLIDLAGPLQLVVALSARFTSEGTIEAMAERLGAMSKTIDLTYWSVSENRWKKMLSDAFALDGPEVDTRRVDFTSAEMLSGEVLYVAQNDTSSWGVNIYSLNTISHSPRHLVFRSRNLSAVKLGPITIFKPGSVHSALFLAQVDESTWSYYSLTVVKKSMVDTPEKSLINRQAALYRFLANVDPKRKPPLAP